MEHSFEESIMNETVSASATVAKTEATVITEATELVRQLVIKYDTVMIMFVFIDAPEEERAIIRQQYAEKWSHSTGDFPNAGLDLITPPSFDSTLARQYKVDYKLKVSAYLCNRNGSMYPTGFYLYPRSSISKTPFRLANSVGIIDSGYRGNLIAMLDNNEYTEQTIIQMQLDSVVSRAVFNASEYAVINSKLQNGFNNTIPVTGERYVQICAPNLCPIVYQFVDSIEELGSTTERGTGGFGSTGK